MSHYHQKRREEKAHRSKTYGCAAFFAVLFFFLGLCSFVLEAWKVVPEGTTEFLIMLGGICFCWTVFITS